MGGSSRNGSTARGLARRCLLFVVPVLVVLLRPSLIDEAASHGLIGAFQADGARYMWPNEIEMYTSAAQACQIHASCMIARVWSKLGKSRMRPLQVTMMLSTTTPPQNQTFSPPLNLPEGMCLPLAITATAPSRNFRSYALGRLWRTYSTIIAATETMKIGATKLCRFLESAVSQPKSV